MTCQNAPVSTHRGVLVLGGVSGLVFMAIVLDLAVGHSVADLDDRILRATTPIKPGAVTDLAQAVASAGMWAVQGGFAVALALIVAAFRRSLRPLVLMSTALAMLAVTVLTFKHAIGRLPPPLDANQLFADSAAYPSGHAAAAVVVGAVSARMLGDGAGSRTRLLLLTTAGAWALVTGWSRVHLHAHWASDVVGGWALGVVVVTATVAVESRRGVTP